jgi:hypothetical protein
MDEKLAYFSTQDPIPDLKAREKQRPDTANARDARLIELVSAMSAEVLSDAEFVVQTRSVRSEVPVAPVIPPAANSFTEESSYSAKDALDDTAADDDHPMSVDGDADDYNAADDASHSSSRHAKKRSKTVALPSSVPAGTSSYS